MTSQKRQPRRLVEREDLDGDLAKVASLLAGTEAPQPSPGARARVWNRLGEPKPVRKPWALAAVSGAALAVAIGLVLRSLEPAVVEVIGGSEHAVIAETTTPRARLVRSRKGQVQVIVGGLIRLELSPETELLAEARAEEVAIELVAGGLTATPLTGAAPRLSLSSGPFTLAGVDVSARVTRMGADGLSVELLSGEASLRGPAGERRLSSGQRFDSAEAAAVVEERSELPDPVRAEPGPPASARVRSLRAPLAPRGLTEAAPDDPVALEAAKLEPAPGRKLRRGRAKDARFAPARSEDSRSRPRALGASDEETPADRSKIEELAKVRDRAEETPGERARVESNARPRESAGDATPPIPDGPKAPDWAALYRQAREERDPNRAIPLFDRLAASGSSWAEVSAYQAARLEVRRGRCRPAIDRFQSLMGGAFDPEARLGVLECQLHLGQLGAAERSLDAFLAAHPKSEREAELRFLRAELMRKKDRCVDAIPDYESAERSRHADDALYFAAWCKLHVGRTSEGLETLRRYLDRFPGGRHAAEAKKKL